MNENIKNLKEQIVYKKVSELILNEKNPRKNDNAVPQVMKSIEKYGFKNPLIIDSNNKVWCGNTRLKASKELGIEEVPCIIANDLTEKQIREYALLDNKTNELADWDFDLLKDELEDLDLDDFDVDWQLPNEDIDWASVEDLSEKEYEEPEHKMLECPFCHHIDRDIHFKKVNVTDIEMEENNKNEDEE